MGVKYLWKLLAPSGKLVDISTLRGKKLAVDASIWLTQFLKAMRDEDGKMVPNAHLIGAIRRITKLLFHKIKPVFVFDGGAPFLKRRTNEQRRTKSSSSKASARRALERLVLTKVVLGHLETRDKPSGAAPGFIAPASMMAPTADAQVPPTLAASDPLLMSADNAAAKRSDVARAVTTSSSQQQQQASLAKPGAASVSPHADIILPSLVENVDLAAVAALPVMEQYQVIHGLKQQARERKRDVFLPVSGNPDKYSALQLHSFLKDAKRNRELDSMTKALNKSMEENPDLIGLTSQADRLFTSKEKAQVTGNPDSVFRENELGAEEVVSEEDQIQQAIELSLLESNRRGQQATEASYEAFEAEDLKQAIFLSQQQQMAGQGTTSSTTTTTTTTTSSSSSMLNATRHPSASTTTTSSSTSFADVAPPPPAAVSRRHAEYENELALAIKLSQSVAVPTPPQNAPVELEPSSHLPVDLLNVEWEDDDDDEKGEEEETTDHPKADEAFTSSTKFSEDERVALVSKLVKPATLVPISNDKVKVTFRVKDISYASSVLFDEETMARASSSSSPSPAPAEPKSAATSNRVVGVESAESADAQKRWANQGKTTTTGRPNESEVDEEAELARIMEDERGISAEAYRDLVSPYVAPAVISASQAVERALKITESLTTSTSSVLKRRFGIEESRVEEEEEDAGEVLLVDDDDDVDGGVRDVPLESDEQAPQLRTLNDVKLEQIEARREHARASRDAATVTPEMRYEVMELLKLFGLPIIEAPMEAEAQCAELEMEGLVHGVVTEDSDALLFGARKVYKNIFSDKKFVEEFDMSVIERLLALERMDLVRLALLLGSDYTTGINGIGSVNALEVIRAFRGTEGLNDFKEWMHKTTHDDLMAAQAAATTSADDKEKKTDDPESSDVKTAATRRKAKKPKPVQPADEKNTPARIRFKKSHKQSRRSWIIPDDFPSEQVIDAYKSPRVDKFDHLDIEAPDVEGLKAFCRDRLGWTPEQISQSVLTPLAAYTAAGPTQASMDQFIVGYGDQSRFAAVKSKRMARAFQGLIEEKHGGNGSLEDEVLAVDKDGTPLALSEAVVKWTPSKKLKPTKEDATPKKKARDSKPKTTPSKRKRTLKKVVVSDSSSSSSSAVLEVVDDELPKVTAVENNEESRGEECFRIQRAGAHRRMASQAALEKIRVLDDDDEEE